MKETLGLIGLVAIVVCWIPQTYESIKRGYTNMNLYFLLIYFIGSLSLTIYAIGNYVFFTLNFLASVGSLINLYFKFFPRVRTNPKKVNEISSCHEKQAQS
ncbi:PQ-loop repeat-containing protein [Candidatus Kryptobacter tengchongensis]|uniref:PQ-loop repeat-containing protein n=1 Tax=Kryptobacter tengchongensis TaxID=1643429 RepID=UPI000707AA39|nr:PQ-loop repeat-containing protein [Candidatus Kryptobacter tengchongensis]CUS77151.1 MtN3 and saliva related transmembrane protein [Candidatus Kryptobacter tengchongensis]